MRFLIFIFFFFQGACYINAQEVTYYNDPFIQDLIAQMTLEEKVGQMNLLSSFYDVTGPAPQQGSAQEKYDDITKGRVGGMLNVAGAENTRKFQELAMQSRLKIPVLFGFDVIHGHQTLFPVPLAESASWDMEAIEKGAQVAAAEASSVGIHWTFAPMVDISRDARWGRVMEGGGEDPFLGSAIARARVRGLQGDDLSADHTIAACAKHFAGYGFAEAGRDYNTVDIGLSTLYNIVFPPFKACVDEGVMTFMNAFNELNGIPATGDVFLQRDILKGLWGFNGFMVSDWGSIKEMHVHRYAEDLKHAAALAATAGSDMDMESYAYDKHLKDLVEEGVIKESTVDDAVARILWVKKQLGLFEDPFRYCNTDREQERIFNPEHLAASLDMAKKSIVLLKNEDNILPLNKSGQKIVVIGDLADDKNSPLGSWRLQSKDDHAVSVLEGLAAYDQNTYQFEQGVPVYSGEQSFVFELAINTTDRSGMAEAVAAAKDADVVIMALGEHGFQSGESRCRTQLDLPGLQQELLEAVHAVNENMVLVQFSGRPLSTSWAADHIPAIVQAWQLGSQSGHAIAAVLYGDYNPSGKMPMTVPRSAGQVPIYYNHKSTGRPVNVENNVFWSHYIDAPNDPLYPFGHGLSYTEFEYSDLKAVVLENQQSVEIQVTLKNIGDREGKEVAQLYLRDRYASVTRPVRELKGFEKLSLASGQSTRLSFTLTNEELGFYNNNGTFVVEPGDFDVWVGGHSNAELGETFTISWRK